MPNTPPATDRVPHQPLEESAVLQEPTDLQEQGDSIELIPSLEPCLSPTSYSLSLVSVLLRLPFCPPYSFITVHCSATPPQQDADVAEIRRWHKKRGWRDVGYHFVIRRNGDVELGRPLSQTGAHVKGHNKGNIGVCRLAAVMPSCNPKTTSHLRSARRCLV